MQKPPIRVGIIGAGWWAANTHVPALRACENVEIAAACRRDPERLAEFAAKMNVPQTYADHEEMLDRAGLDAVIVCSPHALHYEHVKAALQRGLPVLTDKPLAIHSADGEELIALANARGVKLAVFFGHAYDSTYRFAAQQVRTGALGRLAHISCTGFANPDMLGFFGNAEFKPNPEEFPILPTQFRADPALGGGGYLQDVGNHCMSALLIGTGLVVAEVSAQMDNSDLDLRANVSLKFTNGAMGSVLVIGDLRPPMHRYFGIGHYAATGDRAGLWRGPGDRRLRRQEWGEPPNEVADEELPAPTNPDANFIDALRGEQELIAPASEAIACVRAIEAAYRSARTGEAVRLTG
jgi:predicted dehydrogenase